MRNSLLHIVAVFVGVLLIAYQIYTNPLISVLILRPIFVFSVLLPVYVALSFFIKLKKLHNIQLIITILLCTVVLFNVDLWSSKYFWIITIIQFFIVLSEVVYVILEEMKGRKNIHFKCAHLKFGII